GRTSLFLCLIVAALVIVGMTAWAEAQKQESVPPPGEKGDEDVGESLFQIPKPWTGDFDGMKTRRLIRILVPYSKTFFFLDKAQKRGTVYDFGTAFETWLNKKYGMKTLQMRVLFIPTARDRLLPGLVEGLGDIVAGNLTI
ncbi:MAG: lytic transglycosylase F, partial [Deltaproteobacteria bacterium]|nr:lytic transglycosylase F [Deltaproteobacteria bacterium]